MPAAFSTRPERRSGRGSWAENELLVLAAAWADAYPAESIHPDQLGVPGSARGVRPGGEGTPEVNDLAMVDFSVKIGKSTGGGMMFIGEALDLRHRFPLLWGKLLRGEVVGWQGCKIARLTRPLTYDQARQVDAEVARFAGVVPWAKLEHRTLAAIMAVDPERYEQLIAGRKKDRGVWLGRIHEDGMSGVHGRVEAVKANRLYAAVDELAGFLPEAAGTADERRAEAFAMLGDDLRVAELRARHRQPDLFDEELAEEVQEIIGEEDADPVEESEVHPSLRDRPPTIDIESVIDLNDVPPPVDCHEIPDRRLVQLRQSASTFPWSTATSRLDLDHVQPYVPRMRGGPPGQIRIDNQTPTARGEHRAVTHGGWNR